MSGRTSTLSMQLCVLVAALIAHTVCPPRTASQFAIRGRIASRGLVLRSGNTVGGPDAKPTLVEYDDNGRKFALCSGGVGARCGEIATLPGVKFGTPAEACAGRSERNVCMTEYGAYRSVAYVGNEVLYATMRLIAYETDFLTIDPNEPAAASRPNCVVDESRLAEGKDIDLVRTLNFVRCSTPSMNVDGQSRVWAPVSGANVELINFGIYRGTTTNGAGYFEIPYQARVNEYEPFDINAVVTFGGFEPRVRSAKKFYLTASAVSGYIFEPSQTLLSALPNPSHLTDPAGSTGTVYANIPLEAAFLTARLEFANRVVVKKQNGETQVVLDEPVGLTGYPPAVTRYEDEAQAEQIGLLDEISTPDLRDTEIYVYRVADGKLIGSRWGMTDTEVASSECAGNACLVSSMLLRGPASLYTRRSVDRFNPAANVPPIRGSDGEILSAGRFGIELDYASGLSGGRTPFLRTGDQAKLIAINRATGYMGSALVQMEQTAAGTVQFVSADPDSLGSNFITVKLAPPNLKVVATRETETKYGATRGTTNPYIIGFEGSALADDKVIRIQTEWFDADGSPLPEELQGFTGRLAMTAAASGSGIEQVTLPDGGVVEMVSRGQQEGPQAGNTANPTNEDRTGFFPIRPGQSDVIVRLPQGDIDTNHFYIHVDAQPLTRNVDFTGRPAPAGPSFSVNQACYSTCIDPEAGTNVCAAGQTGTSAWTCTSRTGTQVGAGAGALAQRPLNYVPFLTPRYNRERTLEKQRGSSKTVAPEHDWLFRPEMQFTVFSLKMEAINLTNSDQSQRNVLEATTAPSLYSADSLVRAFYRLRAPTTSALTDIDGSSRQLGFQLGAGQFVDVTYSKDCETVEACPKKSAELSTKNAKNGMSATDFLALRLLQQGDESNVLWEYGFADIRVYIQHKGQDVANIPIGETSQAKAIIQPANANQESKVQWEILERAKGVRAEIGKTTGVITVPKESAEGYITIQAKVDEHLFTRVKVMVGCECKTCNTPGGCTLRVGSVDMTFHLGTTQDGLSAGDLHVHSDKIGPDAFTRAAVELSMLDTGAEGVSDKQGLRQVVTPSTFVHVEDSPDGGYELSFYPPSVKTSEEKDQVTGLYPVQLANANAFSKWRVFDPGPGQGGAKRLRVQEQRDGGAVTKNHDYEWDEEANSWSLTEADGLRKETRTQQQIGETRVERTTISDGAGAVASVVERTYERFDWGESLVKEVRDPDGVALTTLTGYYEIPDDVGSFGQIEYQIDPDGNWVRYSYDDHRRILTEQRPWVDSPSDPFSGLPSYGRVTQYSYAPVDGRDIANGNVDDEQQPSFSDPRVTAERINGTLVALTYRSIRNLGSSGREEVEERCPSAGASFGDGSCLRTTTTYYPENHGAANGGKPASIIQQDGKMDSYSYERGTWNGSSFATGNGNAIRTTVTHGTQNSPQGIADKTTQEVSIVDELGRAVRDERYIYTGGGHVLVSWSDRQYDGLGHMIRTAHSTGEEERASWGCCTQSSSTDSRGTMTAYDRDALERVRSSTRAGVTTTYTYDAEGRVLQTTRSGGGLSLTSSHQYDGLGRLTASIDEGGLSTSHVYTLGGRITTTTRPGGFAEVSEQSLDGQTKSVTGDGVVAQYFSYSVQPDGTRVTEVRTTRPDSPMFERTYTDMLGRTIRVERPGFGGTLEIATNTYDNEGRVVSTASTGSAPTRFEYDELGDQVRSGSDVDNDGTLSASSMDRITESESKFVAADGAYWQETSQRVYVESSGAATTTSGVTRTRLTGLGNGLVSEQVSIDLHGNETRSLVQLSAGGTETRIVNSPESSQDAVTVLVDGRITSSTSTSGLTTTYGYDELGRRTSVVDPRTAASETHYDAQGRVDYVKDAAGNQTSFAYEPSTGRKARETNALGKHSYFAYNPQGQLTRTWGDVPYPVQYEYDAYGRRAQMSTYREEAGWSSPTWPEGAHGDATRWHYDEATGLLASKEDAAGKAVTYTYGPAGRLATRTWARQKPGGGPLRTSYVYDPATGELLDVDYNDDTPDVTYAYDRLGRQTTVADAVGTRVFAYDPQTLQLDTETIAGLTPAVLKRHYDPVSVKGRPIGLQLGQNYTVGYGYDANGRMQSVSWTANGQSDVAMYSRVAGSELLAGYATQSGLATAYAYEPKRDLKTQVRNSFGGSVVSQYDYRYDAIGRRTSVEHSGSAFGPTKFTSWGYDERNQVTASNRYTGSFTANPSPANEVAPVRRGFYYDAIGNRETALHQDGSTHITYAANELNQYEVVGQHAPIYDDDGNLLNDDTKVLTYNAENLLVRVEVPGVSMSTYDYDYIGRRVKKSVDVLDDSGSDYVVTWVYSGWNKIEERKTVGGSAEVKNFVWGLDLSQSMEGAGGIGGLIAVVDDSASASLFAYDGNGSVSELINGSTGSTAAHYDYDAFGNEVLATGPLAQENHWRFSTKQIDPESGLYYYGYRDYGPLFGRWTQRDPIGEAGGIGLYAFVRNRPTDLRDVLGQYVELWYGNHEVLAGNWHSKLWLITDERALATDGTYPFLEAKSKTERAKADEAESKDAKGQKKECNLWFISMGAGPDNGPDELSAFFNREHDIGEKLSHPSLVVTLGGKDQAKALLARVQRMNANLNANFENTTLEYELFPASSYTTWDEWDEFNSNSYVSGILGALGYSAPPSHANTPGYAKPVPAFVFQMWFRSTDDLKVEWKKHYPGF